MTDCYCPECLPGQIVKQHRDARLRDQWERVYGPGGPDHADIVKAATRVLGKRAAIDLEWADYEGVPPMAHTSQTDGMSRQLLTKALGTPAGSLPQYLNIRAAAQRGDPAACSQWAAIELADPGGARTAALAAGTFQPSALTKAAPAGPVRKKRKRKARPSLGRYLDQVSASSEVRAALAKSAPRTSSDPEFAAFLAALGRSSAAVPRTLGV